MNKRIIEFDIMRSAAVIWIIAIWHFSNYFAPNTSFANIVNDSICRTITYLMLSLFMFLSGLFTNATFNGIDDVKKFYMKKAKRFYPLYAIASISLYFTTIPESIIFYDKPLQFLLSLFGVATLLNYAPSTLWFMDMLLYFIIITPFIKWKSNRLETVFKMMVLCVIIYVFGRKISFIDSRFVNYVPFYMMGLIVTPSFFLRISQKYGIVALVIALSILLIGKTSFFLEMFVRVLLIIGGAKLICCFCNINTNTNFNKVIGFISYSSMCAYFFHRQIYALGIMSRIPIYIIPIMIFGLSYYIQKYYDKAFK